MEKLTIAVFSATGNTLELAKHFKDAEIVDISKINEKTAEIDESTTKLGILFPVHMGGLPFPVRTFIRDYLSSRDNSNLNYIFALNTAAGGGKSATWIIDRELQEIGLATSYLETLKYPDAYLPLTKHLATEDEVNNILNKNEEKIKRIIEDIENEEIKLPYKPLFGKIIRKISNKTSFSSPDKNMTISDKCVGCGLCSSLCPMDNITIKDGKAILGDRCISCYACYHFCPENAIFYKGRSGQYKPLVSLEELKKR